MRYGTTGFYQLTGTRNFADFTIVKLLRIATRPSLVKIARFLATFTRNRDARMHLGWWPFRSGLLLQVSLSGVKEGSFVSLIVRRPSRSWHRRRSIRFTCVSTNRNIRTHNKLYSFSVTVPEGG